MKPICHGIKFLSAFLIITSIAIADPDPNFHIYIAYGQSNMAGAGTIRTGVDDIEHPRYKMFATTACTNRNRPTVGEIYPAIPPMFHCNEGLSVADWFGRYLADSLPDVTVGIIPVAVGGTSIKLFDKDQYAGYLSSSESWLVNWAKDYGTDGNASARIIEIGKKAQEVGVIKGVIFHQGETDGGMSNWEQIVKKTRDDIFSALNLSADTVPFLAGEMLESGCCYGFATSHVANLPNVMENTYVVKSTGLGGNGVDSYHFGSAAYQEFGLRYAQKMLEVMNKTPAVIIPQTPYGDVAWSIPGKIEVEDYDVGGQNKAYYDNDVANQGGVYREDGVDIVSLADATCDEENCSGNAVGYTIAGEWLEYTINVASAGKYEIQLNTASGSETSSICLYINNEPITDTIIIPKTGETWDTYKKVSIGSSNLVSGEQILKIAIISSYVNLDYLEICKDSCADPKTDRIHHNTLFQVPVANSYNVFDYTGIFIGQIEAVNFVDIQTKMKSLVKHSGMFIVKPKNVGSSYRISITK